MYNSVMKKWHYKNTRLYTCTQYYGSHSLNATVALFRLYIVDSIAMNDDEKLML